MKRRRREQSYLCAVSFSSSEGIGSSLAVRASRFILHRSFDTTDDGSEIYRRRNINLSSLFAMHDSQVIKTRIIGHTAEQNNPTLIFVDNLNHDILGSNFDNCPVIIYLYLCLCGYFVNYHSYPLS